MPRKPRTTVPTRKNTPLSGADPAEMPAAGQVSHSTASAKQDTPLSSADPADISLAGQVLIAMPMMSDPRFAQSVIYVCAHTTEGAMGIVVNRPLQTPSFADLLGQLNVEPLPPARSIRLCSGGPVDNARGFVLHTTDWTGDGSLRVDDSLALTASLDILKAIAGGGGPSQGVLALGYAGWGPGQLDSEIQQNAWLSAPADLEILFDPDHETKWRRALGKLRIDPLLLSGVAGHA